MKHRVSYKTILDLYQDHENEVFSSRKVRAIFKIKCPFTLWRKHKQILESGEKNLITIRYSEMVPGKGPQWCGGKMYVNPKTATEETRDILQKAAKDAFSRYANLVRLIECIGKPKIRTLLVKNQQREALRIEKINN